MWLDIATFICIARQALTLLPNSFGHPDDPPFTGATTSSHSSTLDVVLYTFRRYDSVVVVDIMVCVVSSCVVSSVCLVEDQECVRSLSFVRRGEGW